MSVDALLEPLSINQVRLANRMTMSPMSVLPIRDGRPNDLMISYLTERAKGGIGLVVLGSGTTTRRAFEEVAFKGATRFDDDEFLPELRRLADSVHAHGTPIFAELMPGFGVMGTPPRGRDAIAASPCAVTIKSDRYPSGIMVPVDITTSESRQATLAEIREAEASTAMPALRAQRAGFDGEEIGTHMSYFLASFLSFRSTWRTDAYGASLENRARVLLNIVPSVRDRVGPDFAVGLRILRETPIAAAIWGLFAAGLVTLDDESPTMNGQPGKYRGTREPPGRSGL